MNPEVMQSWTVETLIASTLLILLVMLVRGPAQRLFGARIAYALWALPALRMMLPRIPGLDAARLHPELGRLAHALESQADAPTVAAAMVPATPFTGAPALVEAAPHAIDWAAVLLVLWLGGAALHLGWHILAHRRFLRRIKADAVLLRRDCGITIWTGPAVPGPLATGLLDRAILLPADFTDRYRPRERRLVLAHEVAHHCRGDLFANALALAVLSLHWFNPLAHRAYRLFRADQELACDETVLAHEPEDARYHYGQAIVKSVAPRFPAAACAMHGAGLLKQRLRMMTRMSGGMLRLVAGALLGTATVAGGLVLTASGAAASDIVAAMPVPPAPPAPLQPPLPPAPAVTPPLPPLPPLPPRVPGKGHHVMITDGAIMVDGRTIDPASPEGRELRRQAAEARREAAEARREAEQDAREARQEAAEAAREAGRAALAESRRAADEARRSGLEAARAAREAAGHVDAGGIVRASFRTARASLEAQCPNGRKAATGIADDRAAITAIAANCVDSAAIHAEVERGLAGLH